MVKAKKTIVITGGHVTPALAVIDELVKRKCGEIVFVGRKTAMEGDRSVSYEYRQVTAKGIRFISLTSGRIQRAFTVFTFLALIKIPLGLIQSFRIMGHIHPDVVVSFGGYIAIPVAIVAKLMKIPIITHEQTTKPGLANRLIAYIANTICISWPETKNYFPNHKTVLTGNPLRPEFFTQAKISISIPLDKPLLYISGGSLGSSIINRSVGPILPQLVKQFTIIHQCGDSALTQDADYLNNLRLRLSPLERKYYIVQPYFSAADVVGIMNKATLILSRAGANTISELAYLGKPALLIPLPHAGMGEQEQNAKRFKATQIAEILPQNNLTPERLFKTLVSMVQRINHYEQHKAVALRLVNPKAAWTIANLVERELQFHDTSIS